MRKNTYRELLLLAAILVIGAIVTMLFAVETKGKVLEELSP